MFVRHRERDRRIERWRHLPLVAGCSTTQLHRIDNLGAPLAVRAGRALVRHGAPGRECFLVLSGSAEARLGRTILGRLGAGTVAGELAVLDGVPRTATVAATSPMDLVVLTPAELSALFEAAPCVAERVRALAAMRRQALGLDGASPRGLGGASTGGWRGARRARR